ncbi:MAG: TIGR01459 family HAD-type hydrolase [Pseudomonadota bacterium]
MTEIIKSLSEISDRYRAVYCDLWGCLHNGIAPFAEAVEALSEFKSKGGIVILLTNSPRPASGVQPQLNQIGVPRDLYHGIVASGDAARAAMASGDYGQKVYHIGPDRDHPFFDGVPEEDFYQGIDIDRVPLNDAEGIVCTGLFDDSTETPEDYRATLLNAKTRGLKMLCANPDIIVDRGDARIYCAGAIAEAYREMGGVAHYFGKPHAPIYLLARNRLATIAGHDIPNEDILAIGDGIRTDIAGASGEGIDALFITGGLAKTDTGTVQQPDAAKLEAFLASSQLAPQFAMGYLR